ncbi:MAG TPA: formate--tetrahydrofolate ligase [Clostridiaceae bacterium]|nr:formate--tetrahydrofolate ligase [Clostridiaceae bacterium]
MLTDIEIARQADLTPIADIAADLDIQKNELFNYGHYKGKLDAMEITQRLQTNPNGRLILVTATNPTPAGEGKTTTTIGLGDALSELGKKTIITLREPSLGPVFGIKGGAAGGGYSQVVPMEDINLHFTGDIHAITTANNLCAAVIDNHIHQGNQLGIDPRQITWKRCLDMNDRCLRHVVVGLGGKLNGVPREDQFQISVASEIMAIFCLATSLADLKERISRIVVGYTYEGKPITTRDLEVDQAMAVLLKDAFNPNLVQTLGHTPALMHGGPFANIAHGCNSVVATKLALKLADYTITEAGFGADLGAEKFVDIKCRQANLKPDAAVLVTTIRSLKYNGGTSLDSLDEPDLKALERGLSNLDKHVENLHAFGLPTVVCLNHRPTDSAAEITQVKAHCEELHVPCEVSKVFAQGGSGGLELARTLLRVLADQPTRYAPIYDLSDPLENKIEKIARTVYGAENVKLTSTAKKDLAKITALGYGNLPVCMAKTQYSLSDDPKVLGRPTGFELTVSNAFLSAGAGFVVCLTGNIMTMPGLPKKPAAAQISLDDRGRICGLS